ESTTTAAAAAETPEQMQTRIRKETQAMVAEVNSLCVIAGKPELAAGFIAEGKSVAEVRTALEAAVKAAPAATAQALNTHPGAVDQNATKGLVPKAYDPNLEWSNYNK